jgi:hypothetical protein
METEMPGIEALRVGGSTAKEKTKGAIKGAKQETKSAYETLKHKVTG